MAPVCGSEANKDFTIINRQLSPIYWIAFWLIILTTVSTLWADGPGRVGLVIVYGDGQFQTYCLTLDESSNNGFSALQQSGLALRISNQGPGSAICAIEQTGCSADDCFCQCRGNDCVYWSYWHLLDGEWQYSPAGAIQYSLSDGMVDGWVWGPGDVREASPPPPITFAQICPAGTEPSPPISQPAPAGSSWRPYALLALLLIGLGLLWSRVRR